MKNTPLNQVNTLNTFVCLPKESGLREAYKNDGHKVSDCFAELIDNALDAKASVINIHYATSQASPRSKKQEVSRIIISDNGTGIVGYKLKEALTIGEGSVNQPRKIGKFGIGLKSASFNLGERLYVLTKTKQGKIEEYLWDNTSTTRVDFSIQQIEPLAEHTSVFKKDCGESGTVIVIEKISPKSSSSILNTQRLEKDLGLIYHKLLDSDKLALKVNKKNISPVKLINKKLTTHLNFTPLKKTNSDIKLHFVEIDGIASENERGIYLYFKNRLINTKPIQDRDFRFDHAEFNHLRLEIYVSTWSAISDDLCINNQKNGLEISGAVKEEIKKLLEPGIKAYKDKKDKIRSNTEKEKNKNLADSLGQEKFIPAKTSSNFDRSWDLIDSEKNLKEGMTISASEQKKILEGCNPTTYLLEPRNLNKIDSSNKLPTVLKEKKIAPFPTANGDMTFVKIKDLFIKIPKLNPKNISTFDISKSGADFDLKSLTIEDLSSEKKLINFAHHYKLFHKAFKETRLSRTVEGMERVNKIDIKIGSQTLHLDGVQMECDAGFEGKELYLIEAKITESEVGDINIKQLIIPHAHYEKQLYNKKIKVNSSLLLWNKETKILRLIPASLNAISGVYELREEEELAFRIIKS